MELFSGKWYQTHLQAIRQLVQEPTDAEVRPGEPVIEVVIVGAQLDQSTVSHLTESPFVQFYIDDELIDETEPFESGNAALPMWNKRMLALPRGAENCRFKVLSGTDYPMVRGAAILNIESLWRTASSCGQVAISIPILQTGQFVIGNLHIKARELDRLPAQGHKPPEHPQSLAEYAQRNVQQRTAVMMQQRR
mmetsp:Transcript_56421/g.132336  ORF Transcript_56421/g.132336 Transcript_56421/m.132336 type:complete len:193 (-) Transcript_56421:17-595(-)